MNQTAKGQRVEVQSDNDERITKGCLAILGDDASSYDGEPESIMFAALVELFDAYAKEIGEREFDFVYQSIRENLDDDRVTS